MIALRLFSCWAVLLLLLVHLVTWQPAATQGVNSYNCSHQYSLRLSTSSSPSPCQEESCVQNCTVESCLSLRAILEMYNDIISQEDCMELMFAPGSYKLSSLSQVNVSYSIVMSAPDGGVTFTCSPNPVQESSCQDASKGADDGGIIMILFKGTGSGSKMFVKIDSIDFRYCSRQLRFDNLKSLNINRCTFVGLTKSALDLFNVENVEIQYTHFRDCVASIGSEQFRTNSGAVSIAYYRQQEDESPLRNTYPTLTVTNCTFINNSAYLPDTNSDQMNLALNTNFFNARGGGLGIIPQDSFSNVQAHITNTIFQQNQAESFGGAVVIIIIGNETSHEFTFENCTFLHNTAGNTSLGGGLHVALLLKNLDSPPTNITVIGSRFEENSANFGGGFSVVQVYSQGRGNIVVMEDTHFVRNSALNAGAAVMFQTFVYVQSRFGPYFYNFTDCSFSENMAPGGTLGAGFVNMNLFGTVLFINNTGPALRLVGGLIVVRGRLSFLGNSVYSNEGGALYVQEFGQVKLVPGAEVEFINNTGRIGSAIVVDVQRSSRVFSELVYNPQCFLIHENTTLPPSNWTDVSLTFSGNKANIGPVVFISHLLHCSWYSTEQMSNSNRIHITFQLQNFSQWAAFHYDDTNKGTSHSNEDPYDERFYFQTQPVDITSTNTKKTLQPGETLSLQLNGIDQFGNPTYIIARVSDSRSNVNLGAFSQAGGNTEAIATDQKLVRFEPGLLPVQPSVGVVNISYGFIDEVVFSELSADEQTVPVVIDTPYNIIGSNPLLLNLTLENCQPGYQLRLTNNLYKCQCIDSDFYVLNCEEDVIVLRDGLWAGKEEGSFPHLDLGVCPTPYCRCHTRSNQQLCESLYYQNSTESEQQCHPTRTGVLCGQCINGTGVGVLRANCRHCQNSNLYALGFLVVGDIIIIGFIMFAVIKLNVHFPHSLKGILFYIQTVYYVTEHFPISFWDIRKYMLYVSSVLGLYFPFDFCLFPSMPALVLFGLKFIPPAIALIIAVIVTVGAYIIKARNGRKRVWRALWFLILLLYAPLFHNCVALLKCPLVPGNDGEDERRHWFYDGEVICFQDAGHIVLSTVAIIVLFILVLLSPTLFIFTIIANSTKMKNRSSLTVERIMLALTEGYRDSLEAVWWTSWELFRRLLLISIVVSLPGRSVASAFVVIGAFAMHLFFKPYRKAFQNVIEVLILFNYSILLLLRSSQTFLDNASSLGYTGTAVPDSVGNSILYQDNVIWMFFPFFYLPLIFAVLFSLGALVYRISKSIIERRKRKDMNISETVVTGDVSGSLVYFNRSPSDVTTTEIDGPSL